MTETLFEPAHLGVLALSHRVVLEPLKRQRSADIPTALNAEYYVQRARPGGAADHGRDGYRR